MSDVRQITYDASDEAALLRCHLWLLRKSPMFPIVFALFGTVLLLNFLMKLDMSVLGILIACASTLGSLAFISWVMVKKLVSKPRSCTTTISEAGLRDYTDKFNDNKLEWRRVQKISFENGNIYFLSPFFVNCYIPAYAFESHAAAEEFYNEALKLWTDARQSKAQRLASWKEDEALKLEDETKKQLEALEAEEEEVWKKMEEEHRHNQNS
jgi:hypothetical protein